MSEGKKAVVAEYGEILGNRTFSILTVGQFIAFLGRTFFQTALVLSLLEASHAANSYAPLLGLSAVMALAYLLFGPLGGVFVDTWDRRWTMIFADLARAVLVFLAAFLSDQLWLLYLVAFLVTVGNIFFEPAREASMPNILAPRHLFLGNSVMNIASSIAETVGYFAAGIVLEKLGLSFGFLVNTAAFLLSALAIFLISIPMPVRQAADGVASRIRQAFGDLAAGIVFVKGRRDLLVIFSIFGLMILGLGAMNYVLPIYNADVLHRGAAGYGTLSAAITFGFLVGSIILGPIGRNMNKISMLLAGLAGMGVCIMGVAVARNFQVAVIAFFLAGVFNPVYYTASRTYLQELVPNQVLGRVFSFQFLITQVGSLVSMLMALELIPRLGIIPTIFIMGLFFLIAVAVGLASPALNQVKQRQQEGAGAI